MNLKIHLKKKTDSLINGLVSKEINQFILVLILLNGNLSKEIFILLYY